MNLQMNYWMPENPYNVANIVYNNEKHKSFENIILMQYTGLKDKNGKEIYEGDIIKTKIFNGKYENAEVYWNVNAWCIRTKKETTGLFVTKGEYGVEIIGNIYENQELLEKPIE